MRSTVICPYGGGRVKIPYIPPLIGSPPPIGVPYPPSPWGVFGVKKGVQYSK
tara:strand:- start:1874 stop:2029 length:156 start_codon:yes stop_codon:yes gene_type:complete